MVTGFESFTNELTPFELQHIVPAIELKWNATWNDPSTKDKIVNMKDMINFINRKAVKMQWKVPSGRRKGMWYEITGVRMRKVIQYLRITGKLHNLIANSKGYFRTDDPKKINDFIKSCKERANSFNETAHWMKYHNEQTQPKSRCCGRCDGVNDICVADMICDDHTTRGCETCYGPRMSVPKQSSI